jgi:hypothetical protein
LEFLGVEFKKVATRFEWLFQKMTQARALELADPRVNGPVWLLGHTAFAIDTMILEPLSGSSRVPKAYERLFGFYSRRRPVAEYPSLDETREIFRAVVAATLRAFEDTDPSRYLEKPEGEEFSTRAEAIIHCIQDISYHAGQMLYLTRLKEGSSA